MSEETLLDFPCQFAIKAMGKNDGKFDLVIMEIMRQHVPDLYEHAVNTRRSKDGNYLSVTVTIQAASKAQLDSIYRDLSSHPQVLMAL